MSRVLILFGTTDGQTRKISEALARTLREHDCQVDIAEARSAGVGPSADVYDGVIVAASVHAGGYQRTVGRWLDRNAGLMRGKPTAFISVCLGVLEKRPETQRELSVIAARFLSKHGWKPTRIKPVAGGIPYTRYGFLKKWIMRRISAKEGGGTDTHRDYEYTDWADLERFGTAFVKELPPPTGDRPAPRPEAWECEA